MYKIIIKTISLLGISSILLFPYYSEAKKGLGSLFMGARIASKSARLMNEDSVDKDYCDKYKENQEEFICADSINSKLKRQEDELKIKQTQIKSDLAQLEADEGTINTYIEEEVYVYNNRIDILNNRITQLQAEIDEYDLSLATDCRAVKDICANLTSEEDTKAVKSPVEEPAETMAEVSTEISTSNASSDDGIVRTIIAIGFFSWIVYGWIKK